MSADARQQPAAEVLTPKQLAAKWACSVNWVYAEIDAGRLKACWLGGWKVDREEAERFKAAQTRVPPPKRGRKPKPKFRHMTKGV